MNTIENIKSRIKLLYETDPIVHITVKMPRSSIIDERAPVRIVGVYKNIFQVEESNNGRTSRHTLQYGDVMIGQVVIEELNYVPTVSILKQK